MSPKSRNIILLLLASPIILVIALWFFIIKPGVESRMNSALSSLGTPIGGAPLNIFFLGASSPTTITLNTKPIPIPLDQPLIEISPFSLLTLSPKISLNSDIFGGKLKGSFSYKFSSNASSGKLSADGIQIAKYELAKLLGITEGKISFDVEGASTGQYSIIPSKLFFLLKGFKKPASSLLPPFLLPPEIRKSGIKLKIPAIEAGDIAVEAFCSATECKSSRFSISSSLGQANGSFSIPLSGTASPQAKLTVALTQAGKTEILPYFAMNNPNLMSMPDKPFVVNWTLQNGHPKLSVVPITDSL